MKKDYKKVLVIGSGPIVIGQAAEFDFSGTQACRSLREEGYKTVLVNSNPATIQTDTETADAVYIEPLNAETVAKIIEKEGVDGVVSGMGGQTGLNICSELAENGTLERLHCELIGTQPDAIAKSEDRELFKEAMMKIGEPIPMSESVNTIDEESPLPTRSEGTLYWSDLHSHWEEQAEVSLTTRLNLGRLQPTVSHTVVSTRF